MKEIKSAISIADQIFEQLEHDILTGKYARGQVLSEVKLAAELGVSRTPVREALNRLSQEHIIEETGKGAVVVGISKADMIDMYQIRIAIEGTAASRCARYISQKDLTELIEIVDMQRFYNDKHVEAGIDTSEKLGSLDSRFHEIIYENCRSRAYYETLTDLHKKIAKFRNTSVMEEARAIESINEHQAIYDAMAAHDEARAAETVTQHIKNALQSLYDNNNFT